MRRYVCENITFDLADLFTIQGNTVMFWVFLPGVLLAQ